MQLTGKFIKLLPEESGVSASGKEWKKQSFVIEHESGQYPKQACFEVWGDTTDLVKNLKPDQGVTVTFKIESREYNGKYYTGLKASTLTAEQPKVHDAKPIEQPAAFTQAKDDLPW